MIPAQRTAPDTCTDAERALCQRCEIHLDLNDDALAKFATASATVRAAADVYIAALLEDMARDARHDARRSSVLATDKGDADALLYTVAAIRLRQLRNGLTKETAR